MESVVSFFRCKSSSNSQYIVKHCIHCIQCHKFSSLIFFQADKFPYHVCDMKTVRWLKLNRCKIEHIPYEVSKLQKLVSQIVILDTTCICSLGYMFQEECLCLHFALCTLSELFLLTLLKLSTLNEHKLKSLKLIKLLID